MHLAESGAVVTGAGSGIGRAVAERLAADGVGVVVAEITEAAGRETEAHLRSRGGKAVFVKTDVSHDDDVRSALAAAVDSFGSLRILVNNAGVNFVKPLLETDLCDWENVINTDLRGTFLGCKYAVEQFLAQGGGGSIVNISSVHSVATLPQAAPYAAAKGGVTQMTRSIALEFADQGIRVNAVCPGLTNTNIWQDLRASGTSDVVDHWMRNIPLRRAAQPSEVANLVAWLCTDEASYITGANYLVDGGMTAMLTSFET